MQKMQLSYNIHAQMDPALTLYRSLRATRLPTDCLWKIEMHWLRFVQRAIEPFFPQYFAPNRRKSFRSSSCLSNYRSHSKNHQLKKVQRINTRSFRYNRYTITLIESITSISSEGNAYIFIVTDRCVTRRGVGVYKVLNSLGYRIFINRNGN